MKTIAPFAFIAALVAFVVLPVSFVPAVSVLFTAGLASILLSDYSGRRIVGAAPQPAAAPPISRERLGLAA